MISNSINKIEIDAVIYSTGSLKDNLDLVDLYPTNLLQIITSKRSTPGQRRNKGRRYQNFYSISSMFLITTS